MAQKTIKECGGRPARKETSNAWLQDGLCAKVSRALSKCRECHGSKKIEVELCRFVGFRYLTYTEDGLTVAGFLDPQKDPSEDDLKLWNPDQKNSPQDLDVFVSRYLLAHIGDQFCDLYQQENTAMSRYMSDRKSIAWKRAVQGIREMCDECETSLFNYHWFCGQCGFVVCLDCYKRREIGNVKVLCNDSTEHKNEKLILAQIVPDNLLDSLASKLHELRALWRIPQLCDCPMSKNPKSTVTTDAQNKLIIDAIQGDDEDEIKNIGRKFTTLILANTVTLSKELYPNVCHNWLCDGKVLCLLDPMIPGNYKMFRQEFKTARGCVEFTQVTGQGFMDSRSIFS